MRSLALAVGVGLIVAFVAVVLLRGAPSGAPSPSEPVADSTQDPTNAPPKVEVPPAPAPAPEEATPSVPEPRVTREVVLDLPSTLRRFASEIEAWAEYVDAGEPLRDDEPWAEKLEATLDDGRLRVGVEERARTLVLVRGRRRIRYGLAGGTPVRLPREYRWHDEPSVAVRVKDASGAAVVGVPVALLRRTPQHASVAYPPALTSAPDGLAYLPRPRHRSGRFRDPRGTQYLVALAPLVSRVVAAPLPTEDDTASPVELVLPPTGRLRVRVNGLSTDETAHVNASLVGTRGRTSTGPQIVSAPVLDGVASFPLIPADCDVSVCAMTSKPRFGAARPIVRAAPGATREVTLDVGPQRPRVRGRVAGVPDDVDACYVDLRGANRFVVQSNSVLLDRDATGDRFEVVFGGTDRPELPVELVVVGRAYRHPDHTHSAELPLTIREWPAEGVIDVGTLVFTPIPVAVRGQVVGADGQTLSAAGVRVEQRLETGEWAPTGLHASTDAAGNYRVMGERPAGTLRLLFQHGRGQGVAAWPEGVTQLDGQVSDAPPTGVVLASLRLPDGVSHILGWMQAWPVGGEPPAAPDVERDRVVFRPAAYRVLDPGTWNVRVGLLHSATPLATVHGVTVTDGQNTEPPVLKDIGISAAVRTATITTVDPAGEPVVAATIWWRVEGAPYRGEGGSTWQSLRTDATGRAVFPIAPEAEAHVLATAQGLGWVERRRVTGTHQVVLPTTTNHIFQVLLDEDVATASAGMLVRVSVFRLDPADADCEVGAGIATDPRSHAVDIRSVGEHRWEVRTAAPGVYRAYLMLTAPSGHGRSVHGLSAPLDVTATPRGGVIHLRPPLEEVRKTVDAISSAE